MKGSPLPALRLNVPIPLALPETCSSRTDRFLPFLTLGYSDLPRQNKNTQVVKSWVRDLPLANRHVG